MKALHMLGEVILGSEDVSTVGAVVEVCLSMVIALVIRLRYRKDFFFLFVKTFCSFLRPVLRKSGLTRVLSDSKISQFATNSEFFRKVICTAFV